MKLDWHKHKTGPRRHCRVCKRGAVCRDENERPCHKVCAEKELDDVAESYAKTEQRNQEAA